MEKMLKGLEKEYTSETAKTAIDFLRSASKENMGKQKLLETINWFSEKMGDEETVAICKKVYDEVFAMDEVKAVEVKEAEVSEDKPKKVKKVKKVKEAKEAKPKEKSKKETKKGAGVNKFGHINGKMSAKIDTLIEKGVTLTKAVEVLMSEYGRDEKHAKDKFLAHVKHLKDVKGATIVEETKKYKGKEDRFFVEATAEMQVTPVEEAVVEA